MNHELSNDISEYANYINKYNPGQQSALLPYVGYQAADTSSNLMSPSIKAPLQELNIAPIIKVDNPIVNATISEEEEPLNTTPISTSPNFKTDPNTKITGKQYSKSTRGQEEFVADNWKHAKDVESRYGIPAEITLSQAALESGWGTNTLSKHNAFFSIQGQGVKSYDKHSDNSIYATSFRAYNSPAESFNDYAKFISNPGSSHYKSTYAARSNPSEFLHRLAYSGYAEGIGPNAKQNLEQSYKTMYNKVLGIKNKLKLS